ncbi:MAG: hypothetical protein Q3X23_00340 [Evtepia sp.]|uniref:hypothetical protein n=1 Tax=Evtepia sp. TaxID=2773933 RepID=UPI0028438928|nr:hypothetical protein [Evtepia sp.]
MAASCHVSAVLLIMVPPFPAEEAASVPQNDRFAAQFPPDFSMMTLLYTVYTKNSIVSPEKASEKIPLILQLFLDKAL